MSPPARRRLTRSLAAIALLVAVATLVALGLFVGVISQYGSDLPSIDRLSNIEPAGTTTIYARDGSVLARLYVNDRIYVPITAIAPVMRRAMIADEDERFYEHRGIDVRGIARAAVANYRHERITQGASTISQQLARNLFLTNQQTMGRKIQEALLAIEIERYYTKDEILERYLNLVYFGAGAYGIEAAARTYFHTHAAKLTLPEASMLAGLVAAPSVYSPYVSLQRAKARQAHVLDRMVANGDITRARADEAYAQELRFEPLRSGGVEAYQFPYFTTFVIDELRKTFGADQLLRGGFSVYTTLDPNLQRLAQAAVTNGVRTGAAEGYGMHQGALVAIDPRSGEIVAMVGGVGFSLANQFNRAWQARRQPGSSFKAYVYSAALDQGVPVTSMWADAPVRYPAGDGTMYEPLDDDHRFLGMISLYKAFVLSRNVVAVRLAQSVGLETVIDYAHRMGVKEELNPDLSLALGTAVLSPLDMATGFSTIADGGVYTPPFAIRYITDAYGSIVLDNRYPQRQAVLSPGAAYLMTELMQGVIKEGTGYPNAIIGRPAAGKTGTTSSFRDAWFVGFTPQLTAAVWVGNDDYSRMYESYGGNVPARIWAHFMKGALSGTKPLEFPSPPPDLEKVRVCSGGNRRAPPGAGGRVEYFLRGTAPLQFCYYAPEPKATTTAPEVLPSTLLTPAPQVGPTTLLTPAPAPTEATAAPQPEAQPSATP